MSRSRESEAAEVIGDVTAAPAQARTKKYRDRQATIVNVATRLINRIGVQRMTLADVAAELGFVPTAVIYYFPSKEVLAARCFLKSVDSYGDIISKAEAVTTRSQRMRLVFGAAIEMRRAIIRGERDPVTGFGDVRGLNDPQVNLAYVGMFRRFRRLVEPERMRSEERRTFNALAHMLLSQLHWTLAWLDRYDLEDYPRVAERMLDILEQGLRTRASVWRNMFLAISPVDPNQSNMSEDFLRSATKIINEHGYRGASAEKIASRLNLTKGAFYHYIDAKDDLVLACFRRTMEIMQGAQRFADKVGEDGWAKLGYAATALVEHQVIGDMPLLRTSALNSGPPTMKTEVLDMFDRVSLRFASMICDGVADGSLRPVDANIAAQLITGMINAAAELDLWVPDVTPEEAATFFVRPLFEGFAGYRA